jgi:hypothetical protein
LTTPATIRLYTGKTSSNSKHSSDLKTLFKKLYNF